MRRPVDLVSLDSIPNLQFDLRYKGTRNFLKQNLYGGINVQFLHQTAAHKLQRAAEELKALVPGACLWVFDALRPLSAQSRMWKKVEGTEFEKYVARPSVGSLHNYGMAIDLTVGNINGQVWDMGTDFDEFGPLAEPELEYFHLNQGTLSAAHLSNRRFLRALMMRAGFEPISIEWWHFNALPSKIVRDQYNPVE